jgi:dipeptidase D
MSDNIRNLKPVALWNHFADLNAIPRPSKKEGRVIAFAKAFGEKLGLDTVVDSAGNVRIRKPATKGMEDRTPVVLQSHLDMVHQKNSNTTFDFDKEGIRMKVDGDWVKAEGTTLGADNGIGVATIMALLESKDIPHPPLEALFTIDEETGMTGALSLEPGFLQGRILLNLDTEDDRELTIGCAGGIDVTASCPLLLEATPDNLQGYRVHVRGLKGGHSGMEIHLGRGNANKWLVRLLWAAVRDFGARVAAIDGGGLRNAIPREAVGIVAIPAEQISAFELLMKQQSEDLIAEHRTTDPGADIAVEPVTLPEELPVADVQRNLLQALYTCPNGIWRMSPDIEGLVQTSNNVARVLMEHGRFTAQCLTRSSVDTEKMDLAEAIRCCFALAGAETEFAGDYPGWTPAPKSGIVALMADLYRKKFKEEPLVNACHAGLECGIIGANYPDMEMISFGPNIRGAHSPEETVQISSVQKFWDYLLETLGKIPVKE